jgi:hypothetical protein
LEGVFPIPVDEIILQGSQAGDLLGCVPGVGHYGRERDDQSEE